MLDAILTEGVKAAEARAGAIGVLSEDGANVELLAQRGYDASVMVGWESFPLAAEVPMSEVIRTGEPLFIASVQERNARYPALAGAGPGEPRDRGRPARGRRPRLRRDVALVRPRRSSSSRSAAR